MIKQFFIEAGDILFKDRHISFFDLVAFAIWVKFGVSALQSEFSFFPYILLCILVGAIYGFISAYCFRNFTK